MRRVRALGATEVFIGGRLCAGSRSPGSLFRSTSMYGRSSRPPLLRRRYPRVELEAPRAGAPTSFNMNRARNIHPPGRSSRANARSRPAAERRPNAPALHRQAPESAPSSCARVDSNHHGEISPQGPQPRTRPQDASERVRIVHFAGARGHVGRIWRGGCCHDVATAQLSSAGIVRLEGLSRRSARNRGGWAGRAGHAAARRPSFAFIF